MRGIRDATQVAHHPLRGSLFENLVANEATKLHCNQGMMPQLYFYRDSSQNEVDLVFQRGLELVAVEIKSSQTFHKGFLKELTRFKQLASKHQVAGYVIYSGEHEQQVHDWQVLNYQHIESYWLSKKEI